MSSPNRKYGVADKWQDLMLDALVGTSVISTPGSDAFSRRRFSQPFTIFDSKLLNDNAALFWDEQEVSGSGTTTSYSSDRASVTMSVADATAGRRVRQTYQRFNYQPGKSQLVNMTSVIGASATGITRRVGQFDDNDGLFFEVDENGASFVVRSSTSGTPVDNKIAQADWNLDTLDGTGISAVNLDLTKSQILYIDYESLQVGSVRFGFVVNGVIRYCHTEHHSNILDVAYFSTPNNPLRYEIENDGTGGAASIECICSTVISEGGQQPTGITRSESTSGTALTAPLADTTYAMIGIRLKSTHLDNLFELVSLSVIAETNDDFEWQILLNPTVAGTFTYSDKTNSCTQTALGDTTNTVTGGTVLASGFGKSGDGFSTIAKTLRNLGASIDNTPDELILGIRSLSTNGDFQGSVTWRE